MYCIISCCNKHVSVCKQHYTFEVELLTTLSRAVISPKGSVWQLFPCSIHLFFCHWLVFINFLRVYHCPVHCNLGQSSSKASHLLMLTPGNLLLDQSTIKLRFNIPLTSFVFKYAFLRYFYSFNFHFLTF